MHKYEDSFLACVEGWDFYVTPVEVNDGGQEGFFILYDFDRDEFRFEKESYKSRFKKITEIQSYTDDLGETYEGEALMTLFKKGVTGYKKGLPDFLEMHEEMEGLFITSEDV